VERVENTAALQDTARRLWDLYEEKHTMSASRREGAP